MKKVSRFSRIIIFSSIFLAILLVVYIFVGMPVIRYSNSLKTEFGKKQAKLNEAQELVRSLPNPQKAIDEIKGKLEELKEQGGNRKQVPRLMQIIGQAASEREITVVSLRPREDFKSETENLPQGINRIYLEVVLLCGYQTLAEYIKAVSDLPQAFKVESLTIEKQSETLSPLEAKGGAKGAAASSGILKATLILSSIAG